MGKLTPLVAPCPVTFFKCITSLECACYLYNGSVKIININNLDSVTEVQLFNIVHVAIF